MTDRLTAGYLAAARERPVKLAPRCAAHADTGSPLLGLQGHAVVVGRQAGMGLHESPAATNFGWHAAHHGYRETGGMTAQFRRLLVVVTGVVFAALRFWLHCHDCGSPV